MNRNLSNPLFVKPADPAPILWTPRQAAAALQISERTLYQWTRDGLLPAVKISRTVRYMPAAVQRRLEQLQEQSQ